MVKLQKDFVEVGVTVRDGDAVVAFYRDLLGFQLDAELPVAWGGTLRIMSNGGATVKLLTNDTPPTDSNPGNGPQGGFGIRWITLWVADLDSVVDACKAAGHTVISPINADYPGVKFAMIADPDENWVELMEGVG